jgi:hypothetical protein
MDLDSEAVMFRIGGQIGVLAKEIAEERTNFFEAAYLLTQ